MSEDVTRAVGGESDQGIVIAGKTCKLRPLSIREIGELERACLRQYKRQYLQTFSDNLDLLSESDRQELMLKTMEKVASWDVNHLPPKYVFIPEKVAVNSKLIDWMRKKYPDFEAPPDDKDQLKNKLVQNVVATALDNQDLSEAEYAGLVGSLPIKEKVGYVNWWITGSFDGMLEMIYAALAPNGITKDEIIQELADKPTLMVELSRELEHLSSPQSGNT